MAVYICAANIRNSFGTEKSFLIKFLFLVLFHYFPPKNTDYFGSEMVNSDHLSFSLFTLILPLWALITCST